jgi:hypothetical protein
LPKEEIASLDELSVFEKMAEASLDELDAFEEDEDLCDDSALQKYRNERLKQLKEATVKNRWGQVIEISRFIH